MILKSPSMVVSAFAGRAGIDPQERVGRAHAHEAGQEREDPDITPRPNRSSYRQSDEGESCDDSHSAINGSRLLSGRWSFRGGGDCNVVAREEADGSIIVAFLDPEAVVRLVDKPEVHALGKEVRALLKRVCASL